MNNKSIYQLAAFSIAVLGGLGTASVTLAQASEQNEARFLQEAITIIYEEDRDQTFTAQEILDDGYKLCTKLAEAQSENNDLGALAESAVRSALGGSSATTEEADNPKMVKAAERFLCDS